MLQVRDVQVRYGDRLAVAGVDLDVADGEVVAVLGPSGCGKSTLLRAIAGLEPLAGGRVVLDGEDLRTRRPDQRHVGLMFQDHALFPHRTVGDNVAFGPRMRGLPADEIRGRVDEALTLVELGTAVDRAVTELSGGEQQRVALARALATRPRLLMLDEPLGSLDRRLRDQLLEQLPEVFSHVGCGVLYVTHDQEEALSLADRVAVMRAGRILQDGPPAELWRAPTTAFVARFLGLDQLVPATVRAGIADTPLGRFTLPATVEGEVTLLVLPDAVRLGTATEADDADLIPVVGEVVGRRFAGDHTVVTVAVPGVNLRATVWGDELPPIGETVEVRVDPHRIRVLPADDGTVDEADDDTDVPDRSMIRGAGEHRPRPH